VTILTFDLVLAFHVPVIFGVGRFVRMSLLILFASVPSYATPLANIMGRNGEPPPLIAEDSRMVSNIVVSCLFTLLTSIWCCIRPDIPSPSESTLRVLRTKLNIVFWTLLSPELILYWAFRQWYEAGKIAKEYKSRSLL